MLSKLFDKVDDLSDRFGAMTVKELRQGTRRGMFVFPFIVIHLLAVFAIVIEFFSTDIEGFSDVIGVLNVYLFFNSGFFWVVAGLICVLLMPLGGLVLMGQELEDGNHELLLMTSLNRWSIVWGKFFTLWGLCLITFSSLFPYLIVRYFIGGIDVWRNVSLILSVICFSAMLCAGAIAASSFRQSWGKISVIALFILSMLFTGLGPLMSSYFISGGCGVYYHINAFLLTVCFTITGVSVARSSIRLNLHHFEIDPRQKVMTLLICSPVVVTLAVLFTCGYGAIPALIGIISMAIYTDKGSELPHWMIPHMKR